MEELGCYLLVYTHRHNGTYLSASHGQCSEVCGTLHGYMPVSIMVVIVQHLVVSEHTLQVACASLHHGMILRAHPC